ncbi:hypothetical protein R50073_28420 [Maricurvus nonylphenolicus]|uniref:VOC family protein n=1 Tax=Maricurvus nonylphenolicus TaxID=1008307 RepID=UPI0036F43EFA
MIDAFSRIRIAVPELPEAVAAYQTLLSQTPVWQGEVISEGCHIATAWFVLANTVLELYEAQGCEKACLTGLVLRASEDVSLPGLGKEISQHYRNQQQSIVAPIRQFSPDSSRGLDLFIEQGELISALIESRPDQDLHKVDHVVLYTADADACVRLFGEEGLGIRLALDQTVLEWGGRMLFFRTGKLTLEVIAPNKGLEGNDYFWGIAYQVDDMDKVHSGLQAQGVEMSDIRKGRKPGTRVATLKSHDLRIPTLLVEPSR